MKLSMSAWGSSADYFADFSAMSASGWKPVLQEAIFDNAILNGCFSQ
jgi:hypothetical protein